MFRYKQKAHILYLAFQCFVFEFMMPNSRQPTFWQAWYKVLTFPQHLHLATNSTEVESLIPTSLFYLEDATCAIQTQLRTRVS